ncbi:hypothetical protein CSUB01_00434 [Colletotrichum sublineola]|uniref:Uncharacterized protein n=1 Tax=Colletotrichum sublineola TaxID=1173701 RepID=A0A066X683_COLSU|nr:hypothetical protein CSUB01_00434 [Colletotrichum sublineola]
MASTWQIPPLRGQARSSPKTPSRDCLTNRFIQALVRVQSRGSMFTLAFIELPPSQGLDQSVGASPVPLPVEREYLRAGGGAVVTGRKPDVQSRPSGRRGISPRLWGVRRRGREGEDTQKVRENISRKLHALLDSSSEPVKASWQCSPVFPGGGAVLLARSEPDREAYGPGREGESATPVTSRTPRPMGHPEPQYMRLKPREARRSQPDDRDPG